MSTSDGINGVSITASSLPQTWPTISGVCASLGVSSSSSAFVGAPALGILSIVALLSSNTRTAANMIIMLAILCVTGFWMQFAKDEDAGLITLGSLISIMSPALLDFGPSRKPKPKKDVASFATAQAMKRSNDAVISNVETLVQGFARGVSSPPSKLSRASAMIGRMPTTVRPLRSFQLLSSV
jgi:hypothetical protein